MVAQLMKLAIPWFGRRSPSRHDDLQARLKSAEEQFYESSNRKSELCAELDKKIKRNDTATKIATRLIGSGFICHAMSPEDLNCDDCPWGANCELRKAKFSALSREAMND